MKDVEKIVSRMKNNRLSIFIILLLTLFYCQPRNKEKSTNSISFGQESTVESEETPYLNLDSLIDVNRSSVLFLSFWVGMSKEEFECVYKNEQLVKNIDSLGNYKFIYRTGSKNNPYGEVDFKIKADFENLTNTLNELTLFPESKSIRMDGSCLSDCPECLYDLAFEQILKKYKLKYPSFTVTYVDGPIYVVSPYLSDCHETIYEFLDLNKVVSFNIVECKFKGKRKAEDCIGINIQYQDLKKYNEIKNKKKSTIDDKKNKLEKNKLAI